MHSFDIEYYHIWTATSGCNRLQIEQTIQSYGFETLLEIISFNELLPDTFQWPGALLGSNKDTSIDNKDMQKNERH